MNNINLSKLPEDYGKKILEGIGGKENIKNITNCITRLRLVLEDNSKVNEDFLINETGATKVIIQEDELHIVYGLHIEQIRKALDKEIQEEKKEEGYVDDINIKMILEGVGGKENIEEITNCITRLRLVLKDISKINEDILLNKTGATKVIFNDKNSVHIVYGLKIEQIRKALDKEINN